MHNFPHVMGTNGFSADTNDTIKQVNSVESLLTHYFSVNLFEFPCPKHSGLKAILNSTQK